MSCRVQRVNGQINKVFLENGEESELFSDLVKVSDEIPQEDYSHVTASLKPFEGKYIMDAEDPTERALGLYLKAHTPAFTEWFGDWQKDPESVAGRVNDKGEPKVVTWNDNPSYQGKKEGDFRFVYDNPDAPMAIRDIYKSVRTARTEKLLKPVSVAANAIRELRDKAIDNKKIAQLDPEMSEAEKLKKTRLYDVAIEKHNNDLDQLVKKNSIPIVLRQAETDLDMIRHMLNVTDLQQADAQFGRKTAQFWGKIYDTLGVNENLLDTMPDGDRIRQINDNANRLLTRFNDLALKICLDDHKELSEADLKSMKDIHVLQAYFRDLSVTGRAPLTALAKDIVDANRKTTMSRNENAERIEKAFDKLKDHPEFKKNGYNIFLREVKDDKGQVTGFKLRTPFSEEYTNKIKQRNNDLNDRLDKAGDDKNKAVKAYNDYNKWIKENTVAFDMVPFVEKDEAGKLAHDDAAREKAVDKMRSQGFSDHEISQMIQESGERYERYKADGETFRYQLSADIANEIVKVPDNMTIGEFIESEGQKWDALHDPIAYQKYLNDEIGVNTASKGFKYGVSYPHMENRHIPVKEINGEDSGYYDQDFRKIANDPVLYDYYNNFVKDLNEKMSYLPEEQVGKLGPDFLPSVSSAVVRDMGFSGIRGIFQGIDDWMMNLLTTTQEEGVRRVSAISDQEIRRIQPRFIKEGIPPEERSKDLTVIWKLFSDMAEMYRHKIQVQDQVENLNDQIQAIKHGGTRYDKYGNEIHIVNNPAQAKGLAESTMLRSFYGRGRQEEGIGQKTFYSALELITNGKYRGDKYKKAKELEEGIAHLNSQLDNPNLDSKERKSLEMDVYKLQQAHTALGGRKFAVSKAADALIRSSRGTTMALNPFAAFRSFVFGAIGNRNHAFSNIDFSMKDLNHASYRLKDSVARYITWGAKNSEFAEKMLRITMDAGVIESNDKLFSAGTLHSKSTLEQIKDVVPSPYTLLQSGHYFYKAELGMALMLGNKVKTAGGEVPLIDALKPDMTFNEEKYGKFDPKLNGDLSFDEHYHQYLNKYAQLAKTLHGFYGHELHIQAKDKTLTRMALLFKSFFAETFGNRFDARRSDPLLQRDQEGFYRTFWNDLSENGVGAFKNMYEAVIKGAVDGKDKMQVGNLRKMFAELSTVATMSMMYMIAKSMGPNLVDDKDKRKQYNLVINQLFLVNRNLQYFMNPGSFKDLTQNVFPALQTIDNYATAMKAVGYHTFGMENEQGQPMYDGERTMKAVTKAFPIANNYNRILNYSRATMQTGE